METLFQDIRFGYRMLRKAPGFTVVAVIVLALGIGANTAIFSVVNSVLLRPLPFQDPDHLVQVWHVPPQKSFPGVSKFSVSPANYLDWASQNHSFEGMAIYGYANYNLTGKGEPESISAIRVSPEFFSVLRARPLLGRTFAPEENQAGHGQVVVLSQPFWQTHFASDPNIVGQAISLNSQSYTVVGVMPARFSFPTSSDPKMQPQLWTPLAWTDEQRAVRGNPGFAAAYEAGRLSHTARRLMDALTREHPQYTRELRGNTFMLESGQTREFERAMAELQQGLWVVKTEERYEPTFSYRWDLLEAWLPDAVAEGRRLSRAAALDRLISRYLDGAVFATGRGLGRLFGIPASEVAACVGRLAKRGVVLDSPVQGWQGRWLIAAAALR